MRSDDRASNGNRRRGDRFLELSTGKYENRGNFDRVFWQLSNLWYQMEVQKLAGTWTTQKQGCKHKNCGKERIFDQVKPSMFLLKKFVCVFTRCRVCAHAANFFHLFHSLNSFSMQFLFCWTAVILQCKNDFFKKSISLFWLLGFLMKTCPFVSLL